MIKEELDKVFVDLKNMEEYLQNNVNLDEKIDSKSVLAYLLIKINALEKKLAKIEYNTKTHWAE